MQNETVVRVKDLRRYFGPVKAVNGVTFDIHRGQVVGFIGANGAGKTTTMRMMVTLDVPTDGKVEIFGMDVILQSHDVRNRIGWMPDDFGTYKNVTVWEYLDFYARAYGFKGAARKARMDEVIQFTDLVPLLDRYMDKLSKGMTQRLCLGRTLLHDPDVLILDEPAAGLDPRARIELKNLIRILAKQGKTIFISSHILSELEEMCDTMLFIHEGRIVHHGSADALKYHQGENMLVDVHLAGDGDQLADWVNIHPGMEIHERHKHGCLVNLEGQGDEALSAFLSQLVADGMPVVEYRRVQQKLEDAFVNVLKQQENNSYETPEN